jgi:hypothetical protein
MFVGEKRENLMATAGIPGLLFHSGNYILSQLDRQMDSHMLKMALKGQNNAVYEVF